MARYGKAQPHPGAPRARPDIRGIVEFDPAAVVFQNAADDRQPKAGALFARRDIGLQQPRPADLRQADAVVDDIDHDVVALARGDDIDPALSQLLRRDGLDGFGRVLDDVGQRLRDQPPVELRPHRLFLDLGFDIDLGMSDPHQEHGLPHGVGDVLAFDHRLRHPRKAREFIDHPPDIVDLPHNGFGALLEYGLVFGDDLAEFAANALGRKLDRRQRIFDFVRDAARDVAPMPTSAVRKPVR